MKKDLIFTEAKRLHDLGLAIHWLHPKSKRPVDSGWTTGPRKDWTDLFVGYKPGMNVGVRLGAPSKIGAGFLAVIDCDVKSDKPGHLKELEAALKALNVPQGPLVLSGRGNGSKHLYVLTSEPAGPYRVTQSKDKVKVHMPSVKPSKYETETLSAGEIKKGMRLRAAWEISMMGEGQQVVLPPSTHPDTGDAYRWGAAGQRLSAASDLPTFQTEGKGSAKEKAVLEDFTVVDVDLDTCGIPPDMVALIVDGKGCEDRSAGLFSACMSMLRAGLSDMEILSVLTDETNYLGPCAFEHTKSRSRKRAAQWVARYSLAKAREAVSTIKDFEEDYEAPTPLTDSEAQAQHDELFGGDDNWRAKIERVGGESSGKPKNTIKNACTILKGEFGKRLFVRDDFSGFELYGIDTPWSRAGEEVKDTHLAQVKVWFADRYRYEPSSNNLNDAVSYLASCNAYHPVKDYLESLEWDGVSRIDTWLQTYMGAKGDDAYLSAVSRKVLAAMVARIYEPGKKFDQVLILEGSQGVGKSTTVRNLASPEWFSDAHINIADKDAVLSMRAIWAVELGELSGMRKADVDQLKEFISRTHDRIRVPYGKRTESFARQCIFIGTTNSDEYLRDMTGNRRFWPVSVGECDFDGIARDRDQLFAEAKLAYELGEPLYLEGEEERAIATDEQAHRVHEDMAVGKLRDWLVEQQAKGKAGQVNVNQIRMTDLFTGTAPFAMWKDGTSEQLRAGAALRVLGYKKVRRRDHSEKTVVWELVGTIGHPVGTP